MKDGEIQSLIQWIFDNNYKRTYDGKQYFISPKGESNVKYYTVDQLLKLYRLECR